MMIGAGLKMETKTRQPTQKQERRNINLLYRLEKYPDTDGRECINWKIEEIKKRSALLAPYVDPISEAIYHGGKAVIKTIATAILPAIFFATGEHHQKLSEIVSDTLAFSPMLAPTLYYSYKNLFGKHPLSGYGNYIPEPLTLAEDQHGPYFSISDHLKLCGNWLKVAKMQKRGLIRKDLDRGHEVLDWERYGIFGGP